VRLRGAVASVGSGDDRFAPGTIPLAATAASVHTVETDHAVNRRGAPETGRLHSSGSGVAEPDLDASDVAKPIVSHGRGQKANALVVTERTDGPMATPRVGPNGLLAPMVAVHLGWRGG